MKVFVTGGTGVLGRPVIRSLVDLGCDVLAASRNGGNDGILRDLGAKPVSVDLYRIESLLPILEGCDAVLHLATSIPKTSDMKTPGAWSENDRLREDATRALVDASLEIKTVKTFIYPSVFFMYSDKGSGWQSADTALLDPPAPLQSTLYAEKNVARFAAENDGHKGVSLRFGVFYGPQSRDTQDMFKMAQKGVVMPLAPLSAYKSLIWIDDAAAAVVAALQHAPSGVYDVAEDEPYTQAQAINAIAKAVGRRKLMKLPRFLLRFALRPEMRRLLARSQRVSSQRFKDLTEWRASIPNQEVGWSRIASQAADQKAA